MAAFIGLVIAFYNFGSNGYELFATAISTGLALWVLLRFGVLPMVLFFFVEYVTARLPITYDLAAWYASSALFALGTIFALALWSFHGALGRRKLWKAGFLGEF